MNDDRRARDDLRVQRGAGRGPETAFDDDIWIDVSAETEDEAPIEAEAPRPTNRRPPRRPRNRALLDEIDRPGSTGSVTTRPSVGPADVEDEAEPDPDAQIDDENDEISDRSVDKLPRWVLVLGVVVLFVGIIVGGLTFWYQRQVNPPGPMGDPVEIEVSSGSSASGLGNRLAGDGVVRNGLLFNFWASRNDVGSIDAGVYEFNENMSYDQARDVLEGGPARGVEGSGEEVSVLIPEGLTVEAITERLEDSVSRFTTEEIEDAFESDEVTSDLQPDDVDSWEGLLFPATYDVGSNTSAAQFLTTLTREMEDRVDNLDPENSVEEINRSYDLDLDVYDVLKVTSLVQSEAGSASEASKIASVIYNRLETGSSEWALGIDASDEYGAELEDMSPGEYRETDGDYNLRRTPGLPPTPISAPGDYALEAAFEPEDTDYMWYVLKAPGVHTFAVTEAEFEAAKAACEKAGLGCG